MSFGFGPASDMHKTVKNLQRKRPNTLEKIKDLDTNPTDNKLTFSEKKATPEQLEQIRLKLKQENRKNFAIKLAIFTLFLILSIYFIGFYK